MNPHDIDWDALRSRVAAAAQDVKPEAGEQEPDRPETYDEITKRIFHGGDLADRANRMFRH